MALPKVHRVVQDAAGNVVAGVLCSVLNQGTGVLATLWQDDAGTIPLSNPMTSDATYGSFGFYIAPGHYDLTFTKPGYTFQPQLDMQVPADTVTLGTMAVQDAHAVAITGGSATFSAVVHANTGLNTTNINATTATFTSGVATGTLTTNGVISANAGLNTTNLNATSATLTTGLTVGTVTANGVVSANAGINVTNINATSASKPGNGPWGDTSYRHLKTNIQPIIGALALLLAQQGYVYEWTEPTHQALLPGPQYGLIQDEVTIPQWIERLPDGTEQLCPRIDALMIEALREIVTRLEALEAR